MLSGTSVRELVRDGERVVGVRVQHDDGTRREVVSSLVVGADGRNSTVARLVGATKYEVAANERAGYWQYFAGVRMPSEFHLTRRGRDLALAAPCDGGLTLVAAQPPLDDKRDWRGPTLLASFAEEHIDPLRGALGGARPVGPVHAVRRMDGFFREAAGPGWALLGDAGHFKDVVVGQGISDAMRQARSLAGVLRGAIGDPDRLDAALGRWWAYRDAEARPMYWLAQDLGRVEAGGLDLEVLRAISGSPRRRRQLHEVFEHRRRPRSVVGPTVVGRALVTAALGVGDSGIPFRQAVSETLHRERTRRRVTHATPGRPPEPTIRFDASLDHVCAPPTSGVAVSQPLTRAASPALEGRDSHVRT
jgi:2-polyprenyl-6-methoxyphenol hydroxylase-like FAD-dependent oxidoreductase